MLALAATVFAARAFATAGPGQGRALEIRLAAGTIRLAEGQPLRSDDLAPGWYRAAAGAAVGTSARGFEYPAALARGPLSPGGRGKLRGARAGILAYLPGQGHRLRLLS